MGSVGATTTLSAPVNGVFQSKRGKSFSYTLHPDGFVEMWETRTVTSTVNGRAVGGSKLKDFYRTPTKELKDYLRDKYNVEVR